MQIIIISRRGKKKIISVVIGKELNKIQHPFMMKITSKIGIEGNFLNLGKCIYQKPTSIIIFSDVKKNYLKNQKQDKNAC